MADNFEIKYASGAKETIRATETGSLAAGNRVMTIHVNAQAVDSAGDAIASDNPLEVKLGDGTTSLVINTDGSVQVKNTNTDSLLEQVLSTLKKIEYHLAIASDENLKEGDV